MIDFPVAHVAKVAHEFAVSAVTIGELQYGVAAAADPLTDERNGRSAAAIRKLGATDLGIRQEHLVRRDGTRRQSRSFRLDRPGPSMPA